jgi:hypothetical protein
MRCFLSSFFAWLVLVNIIIYTEGIGKRETRNITMDDNQLKEEQNISTISHRSALASYLIGLGKFKDAILVTDSMQKKDEEGNLAQLPDDLEGLMKVVETMEIDPLTVGKKKREEEEKDKQIAKFVKAIGALENKGDLLSAGNVLKK